MIVRAMPSLRPLPRRIFASALRQARRFARDENGVTVVEFGLLALPFFTIILAIVQTAFMFLATQVLDSALEDASRKVRTGEAASYDLEDFRNEMCPYTFNMLDCSKILLKSQVISDFASVDLTPSIETCDSTTCTLNEAQPTDFDPGTGRCVMLVSAYYRYPLIVVLPYFNLKNQPDNYRLISAVRVFRNEPYT
jgi:Flp pilus assembly protein TadG